MPLDDEAQQGDDTTAGETTLVDNQEDGELEEKENTVLQVFFYPYNKVTRMFVCLSVPKILKLLVEKLLWLIFYLIYAFVGCSDTSMSFLKAKLYYNWVGPSVRNS